MKTITVAELRQNPTAALADVERGEVYAVTRHKREIAHLVPIRRAGTTTAQEAMAIYEHSPLDGDSWATELSADRAADLPDRGEW